MARVHKLIELEQGMTAREMVDAIKAIVKQEGRQAWDWQVVIAGFAEGRPEGLQTGLGAQFPSVEDGGGSRLGFKGKRK